MLSRQPAGQFGRRGSPRLSFLIHAVVPPPCNPAGFHRADAAGYVYWSEQVLALDAINPQVAARLARAMDRWSRLAEPYRSAARVAIERVAAKSDLSNDVREVINRALSST